MSKEDTHKQVLIMDEASVYSIFAKRRLADTKLLLEGHGVSIEKKYNMPFTGFIGCYTILTCNLLPYPFSPPISSKSNIEYQEYEKESKDQTTKEVNVSFVKKDK